MPGSAPASESRRPVNPDELIDQQWLDGLLERVDEQGLQLAGEGGFLPTLVKAVLERGPQTKLSVHLGYEKGDPAGRLHTQNRANRGGPGRSDGALERGHPTPREVTGQREPDPGRSHRSERGKPKPNEPDPKLQKK